MFPDRIPCLHFSDRLLKLWGEERDSMYLRRAPEMLILFHRAFQPEVWTV